MQLVKRSSKFSCKCYIVLCSNKPSKLTNLQPYKQANSIRFHLDLTIAEEATTGTFIASKSFSFGTFLLWNVPPSETFNTSESSSFGTFLLRNAPPLKPFSTLVSASLALNTPTDFSGMYKHALFTIVDSTSAVAICSTGSNKWDGLMLNGNPVESRCKTAA